MPPGPLQNAQPRHTSEAKAASADKGSVDPVGYVGGRDRLRCGSSHAGDDHDHDDDNEEAKDDAEAATALLDLNLVALAAVRTLGSQRPDAPVVSRDATLRAQARTLRSRRSVRLPARERSRELMGELDHKWDIRLAGSCGLRAVGVYHDIHEHSPNGKQRLRQRQVLCRQTAPSCLPDVERAKGQPCDPCRDPSHELLGA